MFAIEPYAAERQVFKSNDKGGMDSHWEPCRVLGVTKDEDGELVFIVETQHGRDRMLEMETYVRRVA
ncbi:hypothetical protein EOA60_08285 [Mesorhizobium sp. M1A.F.Ca.IN.020.06.1.1]|uniref:hypothetical protein n=1 Tax=unclassified Mesorhizobium TaxID=325217 RepID=UPI000FCAE571|nr:MULTISPECIES: hypothetical protein [unclassified Mesorhizobium]RUV89192.1 hypothetical protein EOA51_04590 [Mesorhizobium sp. M1A.F.Ca.IN.020.32.1.1]RUW07819.1 hypothetical protein EOA46_22600 [Mesorhizobium sp. M1A.F.Ca.IN.022.05.2.1]RUW33076.1 hypothetical protein EOA60_08285 [Mesorhizobium sp. M1A.F.Ca.IN.020.06.1.1]RWF81949.1 MAG: hypothetical protein EOQ35_11915 [Mesorhizobium sp.]RWG01362.1 MAG: hypothetical protein EOQ38_12370 [Mesorhizobium sp.]